MRRQLPASGLAEAAKRQMDAERKGLKFLKRLLSRTEATRVGEAARGGGRGGGGGGGEMHAELKDLKFLKRLLKCNRARGGTRYGGDSKWGETQSAASASGSLVPTARAPRECLLLYTCMCICIHVIHVCMYAFMYVCIYVCMCIRMYVCMHVYMDVYIHAKAA
jgi:hypothetical protein